MTKTYNFAEKNGNAVVTLSADNDKEAIEYLEELVRFPLDFRMEIVDEDEDGE